MMGFNAKGFTLMAAMLMGASLAGAGTLPQPGDLAVLQATGNGVEYIAVMTLAPGLDLRGITATDNGWLNTNAFRSGEGYSAASPNTAAWDNVPEGTVIEFVDSLVDNDSSDGFLGLDSGGISFSTTGDQVFVFRGLSSAPTILCGITSYRNVWQSNATSANTSAMPSNGGHYPAVGQTSNHWTDVYFNALNTPQTPAGARAALLIPANWAGDVSPNPRFADRSFLKPTLPVSLSGFAIE
jgi:hypothetical protein